MDRTGEEFAIEERFCGPPRSGNGGYVCGRLAAFIDGPAAIRLKAPPPIGRALGVERVEGGARLLDGENVIAEGRSQALDLEVPPPPTLAEAERASQRFLGFVEHNFPACFVCGPERRAGDGLRIFPGALEEGARVDLGNGAGRADDPSGTLLAAPWTPDASLAEASGRICSEFIWAALDCPGAFTLYPLPQGVAVVLGELALEQVGPLEAGGRCILMAWPLGGEGRRRHAGTALFRADGSLVAKARAVWVEVPSQLWR